MKAKRLACAALSAALAIGVPGLALAQQPSPEELRPALEQLLKEHPELLLDVLEEHCEQVLDIAQMGSDKRRMAKFETQWAKDAKERKKYRWKGRLALGPEKSRVRVAVFSDFTCAYCQRAEASVEELVERYRDRVSFVFKYMPVEDAGLGALASQYCAALAMLDQEKAWKFYTTLFREHAELTIKGEQFLRETAMKLGCDMARLDSQRRQKSVAALLKEDLDDADELDIEGTPYFLVNNLVIRGAVGKDVFVRAIERELSGEASGEGSRPKAGRN